MAHQRTRSSINENAPPPPPAKVNPIEEIPKNPSESRSNEVNQADDPRPQYVTREQFNLMAQKLEALTRLLQLHPLDRLCPNLLFSLSPRLNEPESDSPGANPAAKSHSVAGSSLRHSLRVSVHDRLGPISCRSADAPGDRPDRAADPVLLSSKLESQLKYLANRLKYVEEK
ncbi:hypothetical protein NE237_014364 [Protea cynaroides]|uniref:Uncharacterized protein n=1 Tax=Protea cynaroides TaxID=273540 RepID=A0A9Q0QQ27_9MAGN|nr:hypothetical protein NE237_014364 [Protea cynaroides]